MDCEERAHSNGIWTGSLLGWWRRKVDMFLGDQLKHQNNCIRIVYNNCDGLKIKQFLKMKAGQEKERRNKKAIVNLNESSKVSKCVGMLRE